MTSYSVARRIREIGIRVALGADGQSVLRLVLRQGLVLTLAGVVIGLVAGALVSQVVRSLLLGIGAVDPITFAGGAALFTRRRAGRELLPGAPRRAGGPDRGATRRVIW